MWANLNDHTQGYAIGYDTNDTLFSKQGYDAVFYAWSTNLLLMFPCLSISSITIEGLTSRISVLTIIILYLIIYHHTTNSSLTTRRLLHSGKHRIENEYEISLYLKVFFYLVEFHWQSMSSWQIILSHYQHHFIYLFMQSERSRLFFEKFAIVMFHNKLER
jgi:hypothetical protein